MIKHIASLTFIYLCVCAAWVILGSTVTLRTEEQMRNLSGQIQGLWGGEQKQSAPALFEEKDVVLESSSPNPNARLDSATPQKTKHVSTPTALDGSNIKVGLNLEQRKKGLLWYPTYKVNFDADYLINNNSNENKMMLIRFDLPDKNGIYDNLKLKIGEDNAQDLHPQMGSISTNFSIPAHQSKHLKLSYDSQGLNNWAYTAGDGLNLIKNFKLSMNTNFDAVDFPDGTRSPTAKVKSKNGWNLEWNYDNTMTGNAIGMRMPKLINPGPLVQDVTFFAPVSLFFFFYVTWLTSTIRAVRLHPMHYFFLGAAFFSFHLLLAYSVDHIPLEWSFLACSCVSVFLVMSYISRVIPDRRFVQQLGVSQFVYLILFSYTFFLEQFTGLIITCLSIATLFLSMQYTTKVDWTKLFTGKSAADSDLQLIEEAYLPVPVSSATDNTLHK